MKIREILDFLLELVFPSKLTEKRVRKMSFDDFNLIKEVRFDSQNNIYSFFKYKNPLAREAIRQIKYKKNVRLAKIIALIIHSELLEEISDLVLFENFEKPTFVAIPMCDRERGQRGFNQIEILIKSLMEIDEENFDYDFNLLRKMKDNKRQTELKREERLRNVKGVFEADKKVGGRNIILIDDVLTTGATLGEARSVLKEAGAKNVLCVVVAR